MNTGSKNLKKSRFISVFSCLVVGIVAVTGVVLLSNTKASSVVDYTEEEAKMFAEKQALLEQWEQTHNDVEYPTCDTYEIDELSKSLKEESDRIDIETAKKQVVFDKVAKAMNLKELIVDDKAENVVPTLSEYYSKYDMSDDEEKIIYHCLSLYALEVDEKSELGQMIEKSTHIYSDSKNGTSSREMYLD